MTITLNGRRHDASGIGTVSELLDKLGLAGRPVVVEYNQEALLPRECETTALGDGDVLEIVQITAGG